MIGWTLLTGHNVTLLHETYKKRNSYRLKFEFDRHNVDDGDENRTDFVVVAEAEHYAFAASTGIPHVESDPVFANGHAFEHPIESIAVVVLADYPAIVV